MTAKELRFFFIILSFRFLLVYIVETQFVPDEYWQGPEVAHYLVFGYGHLTWEWISGLRSYLYPVFLSIPYWFLKVLGLDARVPIMVLPRLLQSIVTAVGDYCFLKYCLVRYGSSVTKIAGWLYFSNWFIAYCGCRTLTNTMELSLNLIGLYLLELNDLCSFTFLMSLNFVMRPSALAYWIPAIPTVLSDFRRKPKIFLCCCLIGCSVLYLTYVLDSYMYGKPTLSWWNFIDFNYIRGKSAMFGTHPFHWYVTNCLVLLLGGYFFLFLYSQFRDIRRFGSDYFFHGGRFHKEIAVIVFYILLYSFVAHKELRFMLPIIPNVLIVCASIINYWYLVGNQVFLTRIVIPFLLVTAVYDFIVLGYSGKYHLAGVAPATAFITDSIDTRHMKNPLIWILMPCYSVPVFTHFHNPNATIEFFTCPPLELDLNMTNPQLRDFSDIDLQHWMFMKTADYGHPDFIMFFSPLLSKLQGLYPNYLNCFETFHTNITEGNVGNYVNVLCRSDYD